MWLLENRVAFQGRRLWLRPGKTYLFGRTAAEPGQLAISHNTISRKHLTITVEAVEVGQAYRPSSRSNVIIEDLATKIGTVANGQKIKGTKFVVEGDEVEIVMGKCPNKFRLIWLPVTFTFSFSSKELQTGPLKNLQDRFEQLDIKLLTDYDVQETTHVVAKKRNTAKGLQALINARCIVTETFLDSIIEAVEARGNEESTGACALEEDFDQNWPDAIKHLPPRGSEPIQHPDNIYTPDPGRKDVFEGYTFVFYDQTQFNNLLAPITNGGGKALLYSVKPDETTVDEFVGYVKNVAGEKGLGCFEDGSEGKGVVLVRYLPAKGATVRWYTDFFTTVSLRLDHRPIEQNEFLEAILINDASILRRPLEVESSMPSQQEEHLAEQRRVLDSGDGPTRARNEVASSGADVSEESQRRPRRGAARKQIKRRFAGFDEDDDLDMSDIPPAPAQPREDEEDGLFVSQEPGASQLQQSSGHGNISPRKRTASAFEEDDLMDGMAPAAEKFKKQRMESGAFASPSPEPKAENAPTQKVKARKKKKEIDVLALAAQHREQEEAKARAEKEDLANLPDDVDLAEIRRLNIVEEMEVRVPDKGPRTREQDVVGGRWDPKWNGVKNFKKFRRRGETRGRQPARVIVSLSEVKNKEFGVGDNYWLEDESSHRKQASRSNGPIQATATPSSLPAERASAAEVVQESIDDQDQYDEDEDVILDSARSAARSGARSTAATRSERNLRSQGSSGTTESPRKRSAPSEPPRSQQAKRPRQASKIVEVADSDDSDDELQFRFGKRR